MTIPEQTPPTQELWSDYRFNGLRATLREAREPWITVLGLAQSQLNELAAGEAAGRIDAYDSALRILDTWVLGVQAEEADE